MNARDRLGFALGVAAIALLPAWDAVGALPTHARSLAAWAWMLGATALIAAAMLVATGRRGLQRRLLTAALAALLLPLLADSGLFVLDTLRDALVRASGPHYRTVRAGLLLLAAMLVVGWAVRTRTGRWIALRQLSAAVIPLLAPLPLVVALAALWPRADVAHDVRTAPAASRLVVLVFDELDATEVSRAASELPNLRRVATLGLDASAVFPPANYTAESMPALLSGEDYEVATYTARDVFVKLAGEDDWRRLRDRVTLLSRSTSRKAVVGWHLPYCAIFTTLDACWDDSAFRAPGSYVSLPEWLIGNDRLARAWADRRLETLRSDVEAYSAALLEGPQHYRLRRIGEIFAEQRRQLLNAVAGERFELVFGHLACPHPPALDGARAESMGRSYVRNLRACDALLGEVLGKLEAAGTPWQLIVTSDHWFRYRDWLDSGQPESIPRARRNVPFHLLIDGRSGSAWSTSAVANSRMLPKLTALAERGALDYPRARQVIEAGGDSRTVLRRF